jgi:hypothetical protein
MISDSPDGDPDDNSVWQKPSPLLESIVGTFNSMSKWIKSAETYKLQGFHQQTHWLKSQV